MMRLSVGGQIGTERFFGWFAAHPLALAVPFILAAIAYGLRGMHRRRRRGGHHKRERLLAKALSAAGTKAPVKAFASQVTGAGERFELAFLPGGHANDLPKPEAIASALGAREVVIRPNPRNAQLATIEVKRRDPFATPIATPLIGATRRFLDGIPIGVDEDGQEILLHLIWKNLLIGGVPDAGKSVLMQSIVAVAAADPEVDVYFFDGKQGVEMFDWIPIAKAFVESDLMEAVRVLTAIEKIMDRRYDSMKDPGARRRKIRLDGSERLQVVFIDELATYLCDGVDREEIVLQKVILKILKNMVRKGRAAGVIVVAATQRPSVKVVDGDLRDLFAYRVALRCMTPTSSNIILGEGMAGHGYDASAIPDSNPGEGWLLSERKVPRRFRAYNVDDNDLFTLVMQARAARQGDAKSQPSAVVGNAVGDASVQVAAAPGFPVGNGVPAEKLTLVVEQLNDNDRSAVRLLGGAWGGCGGGRGGYDAPAAMADRITTDKLGTALQVSKNTAYRVVTRLEASGIIAKTRPEPTKGQASAWVLGLTEFGKLVAETLMKEES